METLTRELIGQEMIYVTKYQKNWNIYVETFIYLYATWMYRAKVRAQNKVLFSMI